MKKNTNVSFQNSNLYLLGCSMDTNGNKTIMLSYPNTRAFSIQTSQLKKNHSLLRGLKTAKDMLSLSISDLCIIEKEVIAYIKNYGTPVMRLKLRTYR